MSLAWAEGSYHTESETEAGQPGIQSDNDSWVSNSGLEPLGLMKSN